MGKIYNSILTFKVTAHIGIKGNEEAAKQAMHIPGMTTTRLPHTDH